MNTQDSREVSVIGLGYVGLTLSIALAQKGIQVYGSEKNPDLRERLRSGEPHFFEEGLEKALRNQIKNGNFKITDETPKGSNTYILCVSTPFNKTKGEADLEVFKSASYELAQNLRKGSLVINRATVPIGATRKVMLPILESKGYKCGEDFDLAFAPERTLEGKAMSELFSNTQIIGGFNQRGSDRASSLFRSLTPTIVNVSSIEAAESVKLLDNTYRDITFSIANMFAGLCEDVGLDAHEIISSANVHFARNRIPLPSPGVGGTCLTKDPRILQSSSPLTDSNLIYTARTLNESIPERMVKRIYDKLESAGNDSVDPRFYLMGFAFKGEPVTNDMRDSTSLWFLNELKKRSNNIAGYDPVVHADKIRALGIEYVDQARKGFEGADCVVLLNNHRSYENLEVAELTKVMKKPGIIFDSWRKLPEFQYASFRREYEQKGIHYMSIGL